MVVGARGGESWPRAAGEAAGSGLQSDSVAAPGGWGGEEAAGLNVEAHGAVGEALCASALPRPRAAGAQRRYDAGDASLALPPSMPSASRPVGASEGEVPSCSRKLLGSAAPSEEEKPSTLRLASFVLCVMGIWIQEPVMALVDISFVGRYPSAGGFPTAARPLAVRGLWEACASPLLLLRRLLPFNLLTGSSWSSGDYAAASEQSVELAAIGPATQVVDGSTFLLAFLAVATIHLHAQAYGGGRKIKAAQLLHYGMWISGLCGMVASLLLLAVGGVALRLLTASRSAAVLPFAARYVRARALSIPAALVSYCGKGALLVQHDTTSPLVASLLSSCVNLTGDIFLIGYCRWGVAGAAWACTAGHYASAWMLCRRLLPQIRRAASSSGRGRRGVAGVKRRATAGVGGAATAGEKGGSLLCAAVASSSLKRDCARVEGLDVIQAGPPVAAAVRAPPDRAIDSGGFSASSPPIAAAAAAAAAAAEGANAAAADAAALQCGASGLRPSATHSHASDLSTRSAQARRSRRRRRNGRKGPAAPVEGRPESEPVEGDGQPEDQGEEAEHGHEEGQQHGRQATGQERQHGLSQPDEEEEEEEEEDDDDDDEDEDDEDESDVGGLKEEPEGWAAHAKRALLTALGGSSSPSSAPESTSSSSPSNIGLSASRPSSSSSSPTSSQASWSSVLSPTRQPTVFCLLRRPTYRGVHLDRFLVFAAPCTTQLVGKISLFGLMTNYASLHGAQALAAHQVRVHTLQAGAYQRAKENAKIERPHGNTHATHM
eukprot:GHVT01019936.1.p1 GENE.GHVT01019936.1~~GHVT01019936.1.p1  ORF type:complete len:801 (-),score=243.54 GHVT01019936.1:181-2505(-)